MTNSCKLHNMVIEKILNLRFNIFRAKRIGFSAKQEELSMKKTYKISEMSWTEFQRRRNETDTVLIPTGAVEVYGPHLPMGADCIAAMAVAERVAERTGALIAPMFPLGESSALTGFPGTFTLKKETFQAVINELFLQLIHYGFKKFLFITGHAGNVDAISYYSRQYQKEYGITCGQVDWWRFTNVNGKEIFELSGYMAHGHASECGTSVMRYLCPELVHMEEANRVEPTSNAYTDYTDFIRYIPFEAKTANAIIGDATLGSEEKGEKIVKKCVDRIAEYMADEFHS